MRRYECEFSPILQKRVAVFRRNQIFLPNSTQATKTTHGTDNKPGIYMDPGPHDDDLSSIDRPLGGTIIRIFAFGLIP